MCGGVCARAAIGIGKKTASFVRPSVRPCLILDSTLHSSLPPPPQQLRRLHTQGKASVHLTHFYWMRALWKNNKRESTNRRERAAAAAADSWFPISNDTAVLCCVCVDISTCGSRVLMSTPIGFHSSSSTACCSCLLSTEARFFKTPSTCTVLGLPLDPLAFCLLLILQLCSA